MKLSKVNFIQTSSIVSLTVAFCAFAGGSADAYGQALGPLFQAAPNLEVSPQHGPQAGLDTIRRWNQIAVDASGLDHTPPAPGENRVFREQLGPGRASRAMAIVHIAMFDALNAVIGDYRSYTGVRASIGAISLEAAVSQAAHDTLAVLFRAQAASFDALLAEDLGAINNRNARAKGIELGRRVAAAIFALRTNDGSEHPEPVIGRDWVTSDLPG